MCISEKLVSINPQDIILRRNVINTEVLVELLPTPDHIEFIILDEEYNRLPYNKYRRAYEIEAYEGQELELTIVIKNNESYTGSYILKSELLNATFHTALIIRLGFRSNVKVLRINIPDIGLDIRNVSAIPKGEPPGFEYYILLPENALDLIGKDTRECKLTLRLWVPPLANRDKLSLFIRLVANFDPSEPYRRFEVYDLYTVLKSVFLIIKVLPKT